MDTAEFAAIDTLHQVTAATVSRAAELEEPSLDILEVAAEKLSTPSAENLESEERNIDELGAARASGYKKMGSDDAVGAFFKEMARYPLLKANEELELARRVRFLVEVEELKNKLQTEQHCHLSQVELTAAVGLTEPQLERRLHQGRVAKR